MHDLIPLSPLEAAAPRVEKYDGIRISECPDWAYASLAARQGQEKSCNQFAMDLLGFKLPDIGQITHSNTLAAFWIGPHQWMIEAPYSSHENLAAQIKRAVADTGSVTEQTDGWVRFDLHGARCHDVLERLCNVDIRIMQQGQATRTRLEHLGCFLICRKTGSEFSILGPRSSAETLFHALTTAAKAIL